MLVLTRKKGERVMIGDDIVVTVIDVRGDGVRIGFDAPRGVKIQRAEVVSAVTEANTESAASAAGTADLLVGLLNAARKPPPSTERPAPASEPPAQGPAAPGPAAPGPVAPEPPAPGAAALDPAAPVAAEPERSVPAAARQAGAPAPQTRPARSADSVETSRSGAAPRPTPPKPRS